MARIDIDSTLGSEDFVNYVRSLPEADLLPEQAVFATRTIRDGYNMSPIGYKFTVKHNGAGIAMSGMLRNPYGWYARLTMRRTIKRAVKLVAKIDGSSRLVKTV